MMIIVEELQQQAGVFKKNANDLKNKMWWKNMKVYYYLSLYASDLQMKLVIGFTIAIIITIIAVVIACESGACSSSKN